MTETSATATTVNRADAIAAGRAYFPYGGAMQLWRCRDPEVLIEGPAGTGKSRAVLEKLHKALLKYPGMRALICRKTKESMAESVLVTWEEHVVPPTEPGADGRPLTDGPNRHNRQFYEFANGSVLVVAGLDKPSKIMSTEFDMIYVAEATECTVDDIESLKTRLRNFRLPYQQIILDCNPDTPFHWLNKRPEQADTDPTRVGDRVMTRIRSRHEDNPRLYDQDIGQPTIEGRKYLAALDNLTGARRLRLRYGKWVAAEGAVYEDEWNPQIHVVPRHLDQPGHPNGFDERQVRTWVISHDVGFRNPGTLQLWAVDQDDRMTLIRQVYRRGHDRPWWIGSTVELIDHAKALTPLIPIEAVVVDPAAAADIEQMRNADLRGVRVVAAENDIETGIDQVRIRMRGDGQGPALFVLAGSLIHRDSELGDSNLPTSLEEELTVYAYPKNEMGKPVKEVPIKLHDHACDAMRYAVKYVDARSGVREVRITATGPKAIRNRRMPLARHWRGR